MNRYLLITLLILPGIVNITFGQRAKLLGVWVTKAGEQLIIDDPQDCKYNILTNASGISKNLYLKITKDTLRFYEDQNGRPDDVKIHYDLVITSKNDSTLVLQPASRQSSRFFHNKPMLEFFARAHVTDKSIQFEKIVYHVRGSWLIHEVDLQIEKNKSFYLSSLSYRHVPARREEGDYTGVLSDSLFRELVWCLQTCNLRHIKFEDTALEDSDKVTIIVYFNGIRRYLKSDNVPHMAQRLIHLLESIYDYSALTPTGRKRILEE